MTNLYHDEEDVVIHCQYKFLLGQYKFLLGHDEFSCKVCLSGLLHHFVGQAICTNHCWCY